MNCTLSKFLLLRPPIAARITVNSKSNTKGVTMLYKCPSYHLDETINISNSTRPLHKWGNWDSPTSSNDPWPPVQRYSFLLKLIRWFYEKWVLFEAHETITTILRFRFLHGRADESLEGLISISRGIVARRSCNLSASPFVCVNWSTWYVWGLLYRSSTAFISW